ncbi:MAG: hypothetical protein K0R70_1363, partial [Steroidobacteraceae bacterium]|nr:hypothetical protein [Steroidobacteraceae bacterium]
MTGSLERVRGLALVVCCFAGACTSTSPTDPAPAAPAAPSTTVAPTTAPPRSVSKA